MAGDGVFEEDFAFVVFLNNASGEAKTQTPSALLGREAALEDEFLLGGGDAFAGVAKVYIDDTRFGGDNGSESTATLHGVDGVLADVLNDPLEEIAVEGHHDGAVGEGGDEMDFAGAAFFHVADGVADDLAEVFAGELGDAADLGETTSNGVETVDILANLTDVGLFEGLAFEIVGPTAEGGDGGAELVGGLFGHADPDAVFLVALSGAEKVVGDDDKDDGEEEIGEGEDAEQTEERCALVVDVGDALVGETEGNGLIDASHTVEFAFETLGGVELAGTDIAGTQHFATGAVDDDDGDEDAVVGDLGEEGAVEVVEGFAHIAVDLRLAIEEREGYTPNLVMEGRVLAEED